MKRNVKRMVQIELVMAPSTCKNRIVCKDGTKRCWKVQNMEICPSDCEFPSWCPLEDIE